MKGMCFYDFKAELLFFDPCWTRLSTLLPLSVHFDLLSKRNG